MSDEHAITGRDYVCPQPLSWNRVFTKLMWHWERSSRTLPRPPTPLILGAWGFTTNDEKASRWTETLQWADRFGIKPSVTRIADEEKYR